MIVYITDYILTLYFGGLFISVHKKYSHYFFKFYHVLVEITMIHLGYPMIFRLFLTFRDCITV